MSEPMSDDPERPDPAPSRERIAKRLARAGVASRRDAERMIAEGRVAVNGRVIDSPALDVGARDAITVDGKPLPEAEPTRLWRYHKPSGLVTSARDEKGRPTIHDHLPADLPRVMPVGRLDLTSEGLLLLTNDGALKRRLELPSTGWLRRYRVRVKGTPDEAMLEPLRRGIEIENERFAPMAVTLDRVQGANAWLTVGLREGRNREVRRAMEAVGLIVNRLIRISYGPFQLGDLAAGAVDEVRRKVLREQLGLAEPEPGAPKAKAGKAGGGKPARAKPGPARPAGAAAGSARPAQAGSGRLRDKEGRNREDRPPKPRAAKGASAAPRARRSGALMAEAPGSGTPGSGAPKARGPKRDPQTPAPQKPGPRKPAPGAPGRRPTGAPTSARPGPRRPTGRGRPPRG